MEPTERMKQILANAIDACVRRPADDVLRVDMCHALSRLLESFAAAECGWDPSLRIDGILCPEFEVFGREVHIRGGLLMVKDDATTVAPLSAVIRANAPMLGAVILYFGNLDATPIPYRPGLTLADLAFPTDENGWRYSVDEAGRMLHRGPKSIPESSNFHAVVRARATPAKIAKLYQNAGWTTRACGWNEYEVSNAIAELVVEAVPVILHGAVAEPTQTIQQVLAPLRDSSLDYLCECYAPDGSLLFKRDSATEPRR